MKLKFSIMIALIIQGFLFSNSANADWNYLGYVAPTCIEAVRVQLCSGTTCTQTSFSIYSYDADGITPKTGNLVYSKSSPPLSGINAQCSYSGSLWPEGAVFDPNTGGYIIATDCSSRTDSIVTTVPIANQGDGAWKDFEGCVYQQVAGTPVICDTETLCTVTATGTGVFNPGIVEKSVTNVEASSSSPYEASEITDSTSTFDTDTVTVDNGDGSFTDTTTDITTKSDNQQQKITYDGSTVTTLNSDGSQTNTTTVTVTTINADGSKTETSQTTSTTSVGGTQTTTTNINTGETTTSSVGGTSTTAATGSTTSYDANGNVVSQTYTEPSLKTEEITDPNCPSCVPDGDNYVNGNFDALDAGIEALKNPFDTSGMIKPNLTLGLGSNGTCDASFLSTTFKGHVVSPDICPFISPLQIVLYWFFNITTALYVYHVATSLGRDI